MAKRKSETEVVKTDNDHAMEEDSGSDEVRSQ